MTGIRVRPALDEDAMCALICKVSNLLTRCSSIQEIDLNPVIMHPKGDGVSLSIVDSRILFAEDGHARRS